MAVATVIEEQKNRIEETALITGSEAIAVACKLADVDVITAYPIRPYDTVMQYVCKLVANGEMDCEYIVAEGEHSQFEIVKHASACGARVFCGSSGVGWMYAMEALTVTPALRIPMIAMVGNRALDDPGAFGVEHNDALAVRDLGWQLVWVDNAQEALDTALIAYRVAEDRRIFLPLRDQLRRRLPDPLAGAGQNSIAREGQRIPAALTTARTCCSILTIPSRSPLRATKTGSWKFAVRTTRPWSGLRA